MQTRTRTKLLVCLFLGVIGFVGCQTSPEAKESHFFKRGHLLLEQKDYARALLEFRNAASAMPNDAEPYYQMGLAYLASGDNIGALRAFEKAAAVNPNHSGAQLKLSEFLAISRNEKLIQEGISRLQNVFGDSPDNPEVIHTLAIAEWNLGKSEEATRRLDEALNRLPTQLQASVTLARMKMSARDWNGAEDVLKKAVAAAPQSAPAALALGELYLSLRQPANAEPELKRALRLDPTNSEALRGLASIQLSTKRVAEAEQIYKQLATSSDKKDKPLHAMFLYQFGNRDAAVAEFESIAKAEPNDREARSRLITAYIGVNRISEAEKLLAAALKRNPKDIDALLQRAELRLRAGRMDDAERDLKDILHFSPDSAIAHLMLATAYGAKGLPSSRQQELQQALKLDPSMLPARLALELNFLSSKQAKTALDVLDQAPDNQKSQMRWMIGRNWALLSAGNLQEAKAGIDRALREGRSPEAIYQYAALRFMERDYAGARASLEELLNLDVSDARVSELLMETYAAQQAVPRGIERLRLLVASHPNSAPLHYLLGQWLKRTGSLDAARSAFEEARAADTHFVSADLSLAELDIQAGRNEVALQRLGRVLTADPKNVAALLLSARAQESIGSHAAVILNYRAVLNVDPANLIALNNMAYALALDNPDEALTLAQKAAEFAPRSPNVQDTLGWIYYRKGLFSMAVRSLKAAVDEEASPQRRFHLGMSYLKLGDEKTGQMMVHEALQKNPNLVRTEQGW
jgi:tetratricopeptide (TPR) repeat protein